MPGLGGTAVIGVVACWMSGLGRGSHGDRGIRMTQISLKLPLGFSHQLVALGRLPPTAVWLESSLSTRRFIVAMIIS